MIRLSALDIGEYCLDIISGDRILKTKFNGSINCTQTIPFRANNQFVFRLHRFQCRKCKLEVSYSQEDYEFHHDHQWICPDCFTVIAPKHYPVNIPGVKILVSPMGDALGDRIVREVVERQLRLQNPESELIFMQEIITEQDIAQFKPNMVFWANLYSGDKKDWMPKRAIWFSLCNEANAFAEMGIYPEWQRIDGIDGFDRMENYVLLSLRNIDKVSEKNIETENIFSILALLKKFIEVGMIEKIVLVGNDKDEGGLSLERFEYVLGTKLPIADYRGQLSLEQIAGLAANAMLVMGKDNGIIHLAGAAISAKSPNWETFQKIPQGMVVWGYQTKRWFPKVATGKCDAFEQRESNIKIILEKIKNRLN